MDSANRVQILNEDICVSYSANSFRRGMNPTIPIPDIGK